ncbi:hypothetical protein CHKEEEPN_1215 [Methylorubrum podarium]|nr:hypothetical protein CHKEEEPN_1215 [Methylorubrum podarium]
MAGQGLAEGLALARVAEGRLERGPRHAHGLRRDADASPLEVGQCDAQSLALLAEQEVGRQDHVLENDLRRVRAALPELVLDGCDRVAPRVGRDDEGRDALPPGIRVGDGEDDRYAGVLARGDELLRPGDHPPVPRAAGAGPQGRSVGAGAGFGQAERSQMLAAGQGLEEALLLLLGAEFQDRHAAHRVVDAHDGRDGAVAGGDLLDGQGVGDVVDGRPVIRFGHEHAHEAERPHLGEGLFRETRFPVPFGRERLQPLDREGPRRVPDHPLVVGQHRADPIGPASAARHRDGWSRH